MAQAAKDPYPHYYHHHRHQHLLKPTKFSLDNGRIEMEGKPKVSNRSALPLELILYIMNISSSESSSTQHARNICLVSRAVYNHCWPSLHRIVALRNAKQLKAFSEDIYHPGISNNDDEQYSRLRRRQDALQFLYLNNNKDAIGIKELQSDERPQMWMISILLAARNLQVMHIEEYWSISYPWDSQEEKPLLAYPLMLLSNLPSALHAAYVASPKSQWVERLFSNRQSPTIDIFEDIINLQIGESNKRKNGARIVPQPQEVTLSALAMSISHLNPSMNSSPLSTELPASIDAFEHLTRLHLYFAKMDVLLVDTLIDFPHLTHLRLTRPFSEKLSDAVYRLLGGENGDSKIQCLIIKAAIYMDQKTVETLCEIQESPLGKGRLHFINDLRGQNGIRRDSEVEEGSSTSQVINWVTSTEESAFAQFAERAKGGDGVWAI